jgi:hypothetical protein
MNTDTAIDLSADIIDVRDIIARVEELEDETADDNFPVTRAIVADESLAGRRYELQTLTLILAELKGNGGDEQWRGDWYPVTLINDLYFTEYTREMLEDCGTIPRNMPSYLAIDWDATADNIKTDYTCTDIAGVTYWYR